MVQTNIYRLLLLLNWLREENLTKKQMVEKFRAEGIEISAASVLNYIKRIQRNGIELDIQNNKRDKVYSLKKINPIIKFSQKELHTIEDVKKILILRKNYFHIKKTMSLFYKIAKFIEDEEQRLVFINFGYYSTINWALVSELERHCREKNVIVLDYLLPAGGNRSITMHADSLGTTSLTGRLYLFGIIENGTQFYQLPVDRIFMVKKVIRKNLSFNLSFEDIKYTISKELFQEITLDSKETIFKEEKNRVTIQRPCDNDFYLIQRLMYFCPDLYYISNERIKKLFMEKLGILKTNYDNNFKI